MTGNALVAADAQTALAAYGAQDPFAMAGQEMGGSNALYMKFNGSSNEWTYGATQDEIPGGTRLAVDMMSFRRGWICWKGGQVAEEVMVRVMDGLKPPLKHELTDHGPYIVDEDTNEGWSEQSAVTFKEVGGDNREFILKASSKSALRGLGTLLQDYAKTYKANPGCIAIIELQSQSFMPKNKKFGKKYAPRFPIVEWMNEAALLSQAGDNAADYEGEVDAAPAEGSVDALLADRRAVTAAAPAVEATAPVVAAPAPAAPATAPATAPAAGGPRRRSF